jgi:hypothetical protein
LGGQGSSSSSAILNKGFNKEASFSLQRGQLLTDVHYQPGHSAKLEIRNLQLDELELGSLRGAIPKADLTLNLLKRRGQGSLSVKQPRFSGLQGKSLDLAARWSGDVVCFFFHALWTQSFAGMSEHFTCIITNSVTITMVTCFCSCR